MKWYSTVWEEKSKKQRSEHVVLGKTASAKVIQMHTDSDIEIIKKEILPKIKQDGAILDAGIGPLARIATQLLGLNYRVLGVDVSPTALKKADTVLKNHNFKNYRLILQDLSELKLEQPVDAIICLETFYHLPAYLSLRTLEKFYQNLAQNGRCAVQFALKAPSMKHRLHSALWLLTSKIYRTFGGCGFLVTVSRYSHIELQDLLSRTNFKIIKNFGGIYILEK